MVRVGLLLATIPHVVNGFMYARIKFQVSFFCPCFSSSVAAVRANLGSEDRKRTSSANLKQVQKCYKASREVLLDTPGLTLSSLRGNMIEFSNAGLRVASNTYFEVQECGH